MQSVPFFRIGEQDRIRGYGNLSAPGGVTELCPRY